MITKRTTTDFAEALATHLGIHDPDLVALFVTMTKQMQTQQAERQRSAAAGHN
ncbi:hypothetical protein [Streptomyces natalensis]|uniref:hypothetical protein n=1 Tax=Streptomyces natalensis TaxID=68242 RepID=UPI000A67DF01|nr:hypothetical protein [Streptomyces natalensis]